MVNNVPWLSVLWLVPLAGAVLIILLPPGRRRLAKWAGMVVSVLTLAVSIVVAAEFKPSAEPYQFVEKHSWIPAFGAGYTLGVDGIAVVLVLLTTVLIPLLLVAGWNDATDADDLSPASGRYPQRPAPPRLRSSGGERTRGVHAYVALTLAIESMVLMSVIALDVLLFYVFFEAMLIPMYFLIGGFGQGAGRSRAAVKFLLYNLFGGLIMLAAVIGLYVVTAQYDSGTFDFREIVAGVAAGRYVDRDGYLDAQGDRLTFLDCLYYAAVTLSTTGYGDITPISEFARAINIFVITPLRIAFLILLVGTTLEVLTETSRQAYKIQRWRSRVRNHTVVIGYGTKGKTAVAAMVSDELVPGEIVVVDTDSGVLERAAAAGLVTVHGDATKSDVLRLAGTQHASSIIVATSRDDTAVLVTLTAREIAPKAKIVASIREAENQHLLRQSGADTVVVSSETAGRLLGIATTTPSVVEMIEDLLTPEAGLAVAEREVEQAEVGGSPRHLRDIVLGVVRDGQLLRIGAPEVDAIEASDRLLYIRQVGR